MRRRSVRWLRKAMLAHRYEFLHRSIHDRDLPKDQDIGIGKVLEEAPQHQHEIEGRVVPSASCDLPFDALEATQEGPSLHRRKVREWLEAGGPELLPQLRNLLLSLRGEFRCGGHKHVRRPREREKEVRAG